MVIVLFLLVVRLQRVHLIGFHGTAARRPIIVFLTRLFRRCPRDEFIMLYGFTIYVGQVEGNGWTVEVSVSYDEQSALVICLVVALADEVVFGRIARQHILLYQLVGALDLTLRLRLQVQQGRIDKLAASQVYTLGCFLALVLQAFVAYFVGRLDAGVLLLSLV